MSTQVITTPPKRKPYVRVVATALVAGLIGVGYVAANRGKPAAQHAPATQPAVEVAAVAPAEVGVERIVPRSLSEPIRVTGTLRTDETVVLSTKATGLVRAVYAKEGDRVRRGQLLVEIDDTDLRAQRDRALAAVRAAEAQIREAEAAVRVASARLQQSRTTRNMGDVASQSEYRRAQQALVTSRTRLSQARSLAGIAGTESETRVASARAGLQAARERLTALREGSRRQERAAAEATVTRAQTQVSRMRSMLSRREQLLREGAVAAEVVDNARRDFEAAVADREAAQQQLSLVLEGPRGEEIRAQEEVIRQAEAAVRDAEAYRARGQISNQDVEAAQSAVSQSEAALATARAALEQKRFNQDEIRSAEASLAQARSTVNRASAAASQARADVRYQDELIRQTRLYSPVNGIVTQRAVQTGAAVVQMRNELMTLVSSDTVYFEATAPETSLSQLQPGLRAKVLLDAVPGKVFPGVLREIIPVAQGTNRSVRLRISFPRPGEGQTVVGGFARAEIAGRSRTAGVTIPREAIVSDDGQMNVFVVEDGKAVRRPVTTGDPGGTGNRVSVVEGLRGGETVIVEGASSLTDGQAVTPKGGEGSR